MHQCEQTDSAGEKVLKLYTDNKPTLRGNPEDTASLWWKGFCGNDRF